MNLPEGLKESDVLINKGTEWELAGKLTGLTGGITGTAAVLVHGSGPSDMDETIYTNKPFRDLAWGLAESGIDVLRYDKRTYAHGAAMASMDKLTVEEEPIQAAIAAGGMLREMGYENVYLIGHSMGGMLAPRILEECPGRSTDSSRWPGARAP
jgi:pimeloyl-ACP methyl ester carboxylesterase